MNNKKLIGEKSPPLGKTNGGDFRTYLIHEMPPPFLLPPLSEAKMKLMKEAFDLISTYVRQKNITIEWAKHNPIISDDLKSIIENNEKDIFE